MPNREAIKVGDLIEVTPVEKDLRTPRDFGVLRGKALTELGISGMAQFKIELSVGGRTETLSMNCNWVDVRLLYSPSI